MAPWSWASSWPLWTRRAVADLIRQEYGISLVVRTVRLVSGRRWGFTAERPRRLARIVRIPP